MKNKKQKQYWLIKSEPTCFSIDDLEKRGVEPWSGVRNYQARNFMRDDMKVGDAVLYYHSNCKQPAVVGIAKVNSEPYPDKTALNKKDDHYDPKHTEENPRWFVVDMKFVKKFKNIVTLGQLKFNPKLEAMMILRKGNRLSITPVSKKHFDEIVRMTV